MYESFFGLTANPFRLVPDHRFFYASSGHKRGLAYLQYGLQQGEGFVVVTGKPGTGKSTLVQTLFTDLAGRRLVVAHLSSTNLDADDVLMSVAHYFDVYKPEMSKAGILHAIENFLLQQVQAGKQVLLIVDEAQNLPPKSLEELRMLSNFQRGDRSLIQIMLLGQQQLKRVLADPDLEQLTQRVIASCDLKPLSAEETRNYIEHRLRCAGWRGKPSFSPEALALIHCAAEGVPRLINIFCDRLLLAAALEQKTHIDADHTRELLDELRHESTGIRLLQQPTADLIAVLKPLPDGKVNFDAPPQTSPLDSFSPEPMTAAADPPPPESALDSLLESAPPARESLDERLKFRQIAEEEARRQSLMVNKKLLWALAGAAAVIVVVLIYLLWPYSYKLREALTAVQPSISSLQGSMETPVSRDESASGSVALAPMAEEEAVSRQSDPVIKSLGEALAEPATAPAVELTTAVPESPEATQPIAPPAVVESKPAAKPVKSPAPAAVKPDSKPAPVPIVELEKKNCPTHLNRFA